MLPHERSAAFTATRRKQQDILEGVRENPSLEDTKISSLNDGKSPTLLLLLNLNI